MIEYKPFAYPPDFGLAKTHKQATKPGKIDPQLSIQCPCCLRRTKQPLKFWLSRSIDHDFKGFGGAVVTYFWLVKLYAFISLLILLIYSSYLIVTIHKACPEGLDKEDYPQCQKFLGIYIISNQELFELIEKLGKIEEMTRIYTLRTIAYVILLIGNFMAVYTSGRFKRRYPQPKDISDFSLIFKNVNKSVEDLVVQLKRDFPLAEIHQIFNIKTMEPFHTFYQQKLQTYYLCRIQKNQKKKTKLLKKLQTLDRKCSKSEPQYLTNSDRVIVVFQKQVDRNQIRDTFQLKRMDKVKYLLGLGTRRDLEYCEECPTGEEILWNNIGSDQSQKIKLKVLSVVYFFLLIAGSYALLFFCMHLAYDRDILPKPLNVIVANIIMTLMVPIALTFRQLMNKLSQMRRPNTLTSRTMFIVLTTVLFHFIYYIIIPTFYLNFSTKVDKNKVLTIITNQTFNFLLVQFILAYIDLVFCQWNKRLKKVEDQYNPIGCQKILHKHMQYPRFPIEFKLIILFKTFSFIILFAFESPFIMFLCFALLIFLYFADKFAVYRHYRMEIIHNGVQYRFLKIYSVFFTAYSFLIYSLTQHFDDSRTQYYAAMVLAILAVILQVFVLTDRTFSDETILPSTLTQEKIEDSYKKRFNKFKEHITDDRTDEEIKQFLVKTGYGSLQTEETLQKNKLIDS